MSENSSSDTKHQTSSFWKRWFKSDWGIVAGIILSFVAILGPTFLIQPLVPAIITILPFDENIQNSLIRIFLELLALGIIFGAVKFYKRRLQDIGLNKPKFLHIGQALLGFGVYFVLTIGLYLITNAFLQIDQNQPQELGYQSLNGVGLALAFIVLVVATPLVEEVIFRGFMFRGLRGRLKFWPAAIAVSVLFGLVHGQWNVGIDVFALSIVACYLREHTNSLWPAIILHAIKNSMAFFILYIYNGS